MMLFRGGSWPRWATLAGVLVVVPVLAVQPGDEPAHTFAASALLLPTVVAGAHHRVEAAVVTEGFFHEFSVPSDYGIFDAIGLSLLAARLNDIRALAALEEVSKTEVFVKAAGGAVLNIGKSVVLVATDPIDTAKGLGSGVKRLGVNLGRMTKRAANSVGDDNDTGAKDGKDSGAESAANSVLGVSSAMRRWAQKVGADPYTTNPVLRQALKDIGRIDAAGSIATKVVVPIPMVVTTTGSVGGLVWGKDPEELRKLNEQRAKALGVPSAYAGILFRNSWYTLTSQTRLIAALDAVKAPGCAGYVGAASKAESEREALFFVESAEMLQRLHARMPVDAVLVDSRALVAGQGATAVALLPLDFLRSTSENQEMLGDIAARVRKELRATRLELHLSGRVSNRAARELRSLGWVITEQMSSPSVEAMQKAGR